MLVNMGGEAALGTASKGEEIRGGAPLTNSAVSQTPPLAGEMLTEVQIRARLTINSPELVKELYDIAQRQVQAEVGRQTRLDAKATSLLTAAGLSLTVAFTFGSTLITKPEAFETWHRFVVGAFALALVLGLTAAILAVRALLVRDNYMTVNEAAVFDPEVLEDANDPHALREIDCKEMKDEEKRKFGVMEFHKAMIVHLWTIAQQHLKNNEGKARLIKWGQRCFLGFLVVLLVVAVFIVLGASASHGSAPTATPATSTMTPPKPAPSP